LNGNKCNERNEITSGASGYVRRLREKFWFISRSLKNENQIYQLYGIIVINNEICKNYGDIDHIDLLQEVLYKLFCSIEISTNVSNFSKDSLPIDIYLTGDVF
jgi:hypothetical protein